MKVEIIENKKEIKYPWIGIGCNGTIVLFVGSGEGIVIYSTGSEYKTGEYADNWHEPVFKPFTGTITLSND